jgi:hypothetical protein
LREELRLIGYENGALRRIFWPKRYEATGEWRKRHNEDLHDLYSLSTNVRVIKRRRIIWAGHVARMGKGEACTRFWWGNLRGKEATGETQV